MNNHSPRFVLRSSLFVLAGALGLSAAAMAQDAPPGAYNPQSYGPQGYSQQPYNQQYNRQAFNQPQDQQFAGEGDPQGPPPPQGGYNRYPDRGPQPGYNDSRYNNQNPPPPIPAQLNLRAGTFVTVRIDQGLSTDRNHAGDFFNATLVRPIVVDGVVIAEPGQTIAGRVSESEKAGRVSGVSRLAVQLTDLTLADGQQIPIHSQLIGRTAPSSVGRDVGAVAGTTALGAAIGSSVDWGRGAAIGAASGAAAGIIGVLLTRGHPSIIYPESVLTFRVESPVTIATDRAPGAFHWIEQGEYQDSYRAQGPVSQPRYAYAAPVPVVAPYYAPYPYFYGPRFSFFYGGGYYGRYYGGRGRYYGRGYRR